MHINTHTYTHIYTTHTHLDDETNFACCSGVFESVIGGGEIIILVVDCNKINSMGINLLFNRDSTACL
jgi:hypothetical protein